jgi:hypothetical protein
MNIEVTYKTTSNRSARCVCNEVRVIGDTAHLLSELRTTSVPATSLQIIRVSQDAPRRHTT